MQCIMQHDYAMQLCMQHNYVMHYATQLCHALQNAHRVASLASAGAGALRSTAQGLPPLWSFSSSYRRGQGPLRVLRPPETGAEECKSSTLAHRGEKIISFTF